MIGLSLGLTLGNPALTLGGEAVPVAPTAIVISTTEISDATTGAFANLLMVGGVEPATYEIVDAPSWVSLTGSLIEADGSQVAGSEEVTLKVIDALAREYVMASPATLTISATPVDNGSGIGEGDGEIVIPDPEDPETEDDGYVDPPVQHDTSDGLKITGKNGGSTSWFKSLPLPLAGEALTFAYEADWSHMNQLGRDAAIGFAFKAGNDFHLTGLRGDGENPATMLASRIYGDFRKSNSFAKTSDGVAAGTVKDGPNFLQLIVSDDGLEYSLYAGAALDALDLIQADRLPAPIDGVADATEFGVGGYFSTRDKGVFSITITLFETALMPPMGMLFLVDGDGSYLVDGDGTFLVEPE